MGALSGAGLRRLVALWCGWLALWEVVTVWAAVVWLRWTEHLAWVGLWSVRAVLYAVLTSVRAIRSARQPAVLSKLACTWAAISRGDIPAATPFPMIAPS